MLTFRYLIRLIVAFIARFKGILIVGTILGIGLFFLLRFVAPLLFQSTTEKIGLTGRFHTDSLPNDILELISDGLTKINEAGIVEPNLARSWETPDKGKTWIFTLRDDISWQDGSEVESFDVVYEFSDVEIEKPDAKTITFKLQDSFSPFPLVVSKPTFRRGLLGTGEWKVSNVKISGSYISELVLRDTKKNKRIFKFYPTEERTKLAYKLGEVDVLQQIFNPSPFDSWNTAEVSPQENKDQVVALFFNTRDKFLSAKSLRQFLSYTIDKKSFAESRAISPISPSSWAYNPQVKAYNHDKQRAAELIDELPKEIRENLTIKVVSTPVLLATAEKIANFWEEAGVKTIVQVSSVIPTEYQAYLTIFDIPADPDQYSLWHSTQTGTNITRYTNPRIDKLLEDGREELDIEERRKIYLDFQRFLVEDSPAIFLYHPTSYKISRK